MVLFTLKNQLCQLLINQVTDIVPEDFKRARVKPLKEGYIKLPWSRKLSTSQYIMYSIKDFGKICPCSTFRFFKQQSLIVFIPISLRNIFSTYTCLIHMLKLIRSNTSVGLFTSIVMLDLKKAFDTFDHTILCN